MQGVEKHTASPDGTAAPPGDYPTWDAYMVDVEALEDTWEGARMCRGSDYDANTHISLPITKAMRLAPDLAVFRALLDGQQVPAACLDQSWRKRYGE